MEPEKVAARDNFEPYFLSLKPAAKAHQPLALKRQPTQVRDRWLSRARGVRGRPRLIAIGRRVLASAANGRCESRDHAAMRRPDNPNRSIRRRAD